MINNHFQKEQEMQLATNSKKKIKKKIENRK